ncbi:hypothetical protein WMF31_17645 [Sorangium sp. So ce1036]|uniref:T4 family baseplate hub assembly chaperone n=1 Tax=Sorangium sp. So ce1036 TaxID=3133328 RepID=UPI003F0B2ED1
MAELVPLRPAAVLEAWEGGLAQGTVERALTLLALAMPGATRDALADLSIGQRDALLLELRTRSFGPTAPCVVRCPRCEETLEFPVRLPDLRVPAPAAAEAVVTFGDLRLRVRPATSRDLLTIAGAADPVRALLDRCVIAERASAGDPAAVPAEAAELVAAEMARLDPQADVRFDLSCAACGAAWTTVFDVVSYLWREIEAEARRLMAEVDALARAYCWPELTILEMSRPRRLAYLRLAGAA